VSSVSAAVATARHWPLFTQQLFWVAGCFVLGVAPHLTSVRAWLLVLATAMVIWRLAIELRQWRLPHKWLRSGIAIAAMLGVLVSYRTLNGIQAGTAFLIIMGAMKLLESRNRRGLTIVLFVSYFLLFAGFLYNQHILLLPYTLGAAWVLTATLMRIHQSAPMKPTQALGASAKMFVQALPFAVLLFLLFPRLPGQFWAVPARETARTGLDDELAPGDVSDLSLSSAVAFRVKFEDDRIPPPQELYWRGPVLHDFDGRRWRRELHMYSAPELKTFGQPYRYRTTLEPHNRNWLFALDTPTKLPPGTRQAVDLQVVSIRPVAALRTFDF
jgi:hypothetical protein